MVCGSKTITLRIEKLMGHQSKNCLGVDSDLCCCRKWVVVHSQNGFDCTVFHWEKMCLGIQTRTYNHSYMHMNSFLCNSSLTPFAHTAANIRHIYSPLSFWVKIVSSSFLFLYAENICILGMSEYEDVVEKMSSKKKSLSRLQRRSSIKSFL